MSVFDDVLGKVASVFSDSSQASGILKLAMDFLNKPEVGGIGGLIQIFQEKGLEGIISSWVSTGQNLPISADQIEQVLGGDTLKSLAEKSGLSVESLAGSLSTALPVIIDKLTPTGEVQASDDLLAQGLDFLKDKLTGGDKSAPA